MTTTKDAKTARDLTSTEPHAKEVERSSDSEIAAFIAKAKQGGGNGRLIFALDATMSRQPTWDRAMHHQSVMFDTVSAIGRLDVQLVYFRGFKECRASKWVADGGELRALMERIDCRGGHTQIGKVLAHARKQNDVRRVASLVFIGDAMEEKIDDLADKAGQLGLLGVRCFMFQEGRDPKAERAFREIARLSKGAYARFDASSAETLRDLLKAVAAFSSGGLAALEKHGGREAQKLLPQVRG